MAHPCIRITDMQKLIFNRNRMKSRFFIIITVLLLGCQAGLSAQEPGRPYVKAEIAGGGKAESSRGMADEQAMCQEQGLSLGDEHAQWQNQEHEGDNAKGMMTIKDCMSFAVEHSSRNIIRQLDNDDIRIQKRDAILEAFTPRISAETYAYSNFGRAVDPETNTYINTASFNNGYAVSGSIVLFNGFSAINNIRISQTAVKMGISEEQKLRDEISLAVMEAYYNVLFHTKMTEVLASQVETAETNLKLVRSQYESGQKSYPDVTQVQADLAETEYKLINSENLRDDAMLTLKSLMLWPVEDTLILDYSIASDAMIITDEPMETAAEVIEAALETRPEVRIAEGRLRQAKLNLNTAKWQFLPSLSLAGGWSTSYYNYPGREGYVAMPFAEQWKNNSGEFVQLSLSIPIYDRLSRYSNLSRKKNDWKRADAEYTQTLHDIKSEVSRAVRDKQGAYKSLLQAVRRSEMQEEAYRLHEKKMLRGMISPLDFQTVSDQYLNAKAEELNARFQYRLKKSVVEYYKGTSYLEQ